MSTRTNRHPDPRAADVTCACVHATPRVHVHVSESAAAARRSNSSSSDRDRARARVIFIRARIICRRHECMHGLTRLRAIKLLTCARANVSNTYCSSAALCARARCTSAVMATRHVPRAPGQGSSRARPAIATIDARAYYRTAAVGVPRSLSTSTVRQGEYTCTLAGRPHHQPSWAGNTPSRALRAWPPNSGQSLSSATTQLRSAGGGGDAGGGGGVKTVRRRHAALEQCGHMRASAAARRWQHGTHSPAHGTPTR